jgi:hypothetical protein
VICTYSNEKATRRNLWSILDGIPIGCHNSDHILPRPNLGDTVFHAVKEMRAATSKADRVVDVAEAEKDHIQLYYLYITRSEVLASYR